MSSPSDPTPFTVAYKAIVAALKANASFNTLVKIGDFNDLSDGKTRQLKQAIQFADTPEVTLLQGPFMLQPTGSNSKVAQLSKTYNLVFVSDSIQVAAVNDVEYSVCAALFRADLEGTLYHSQPFIGGWRVTNGSDGTSGIRLPTAGDAARGIDRYSAIASINVEMYIQRGLLPA